MTAPEWFTRAIRTNPVVGETDVDGCTISYRRWGATDRPGLVLVHGGAAHAPGRRSSWPTAWEASLRAVQGGVTWKFDPRIFDRRSVPHGELLRRVRCRVALFRSEHGLVSRDIGEYMYEQLGRVAPVVEVPLAWHDVMLDQPIALVTGLRALLADWEHSTPQRRS